MVFSLSEKKRELKKAERGFLFLNRLRFNATGAGRVHFITTASGCPALVNIPAGFAILGAGRHELST
jgi:hypothetical protein